MRTVKQRIRTAFKALGRIDKAHEAGMISKKQHDSRSRAVLKKLVKRRFVARKWHPIKGSKGKARWTRYKKGKHTFELAQKKVGNKWRILYNYQV